MTLSELVLAENDRSGRCHFPAMYSEDDADLHETMRRCRAHSAKLHMIDAVNGRLCEGGPPFTLNHM
jgi:hypothetical protein